MKKFILIALLFSFSLAFADTASPRKEYIEQWKEIAMREMRVYGIPASITLAQGILESADGNSRLATKANNHFGIKCHGWKGAKIYHDDDAKGECFRSYSHAEESYRDHSEFLTGRSRYAFLFNYKQSDYKAWAKGLKKAGYATNPKYPALLIKIIEENELYLYDRMVLENLEEKDLIVSDEEPPALAYDPNDPSLKIENFIPVELHPNSIKFIVVKTGVDYARIEKELNVWDWEIRRYNDLPRNYIPTIGDSLFIQPKRNKNRKNPTHLVKPGETLIKISQVYGVKLSAICKKNGIKPEDPLVPGTALNLKKKKR